MTYTGAYWTSSAKRWWPAITHCLPSSRIDVTSLRIDLAARKYYKHNVTLINYASKKLVVEYYQSKFYDIESDGESPMVTVEERRPPYQGQTCGWGIPAPSCKAELVTCAWGHGFEQKVIETEIPAYNLDGIQIIYIGT
jgi:hypothetical protein